MACTTECCEPSASGEVELCRTWCDQSEKSRSWRPGIWFLMTYAEIADLKNGLGFRLAETFSRVKESTAAPEGFPVSLEARV